MLLRRAWYTRVRTRRAVCCPPDTPSPGQATTLQTITQGGIIVTYGLDALGRTLTRADGTTTSAYH